MNYFGKQDAHHQTRWEPPAGSSTIVLLRHGASEAYVPGHRFQLTGGHGDPMLAELGQEQAQMAGRRLATEHLSNPYAAVYVTTLRRTHETAAPFARASGLEPIPEPDLREVFLGEWEGGLFREKAAAGDPAYVKSILEGEWGAIPGAETTAQLTERVMRALERIAARHVDQRVVCVVHGGVIAAALTAMTGSSPVAFMGADNCSMSLVIRVSNEWRVRSFNDTSHLDGGWQ